MLHKALFIPICCAICLALAPLSMAESDDSQPTQLEEIRVLASPIIEGNETDRYASQKTTVTETQMRDLNAQDLSTALRRSPGVNISRYNMVGSFGGGSGGAVFIRGMGSSRPGAEIKTMVDGIPMYMSVWNHPLLDLLAIDPAQSVEVYKSPQPHLFGNAFGIVNIVPKQRTDPGFFTQADLSVGSYETFVGKAEHGGRLDRFDYYLGGGYRTSDGHRDNADGELRNIYGRLGYAFSDHLNASVFSLWTDNYANDPGPEGATAAQLQGRYETRAWLNVLTFANSYDWGDGHLKIYHNGGEGDWLNQPTSTAGVREDLFNDFAYYGMKAREAFRFWEGGEIVAGLDWDVTAGEYDKELSNGGRDRWDAHDFTILSPYLSVSHEFGRRDGFYAIPSMGIRHYDNSDFDAEWSPHAGLILVYAGTEFHAGYARGVVYPGLDVMVMSEKVMPVLGKSWENLEAEIADHFELGIGHRFGALAAADITWFYDDGSNRYLIVPPPPPPPIYANIEDYRIQGVEGTLSLFPIADLALFTGLTYLDTDPGDLPYAPQWTLRAGLNWTFLKSFRLSLDCQYIDEMHVDAQARRKNAENTAIVDSYFVVNGRLGYEFAVKGVKSEVYLAAENLTDSDYEYLPGYPMPGATAMVGVRFAY